VPRGLHGAEEVAADATEAVYTYANRHCCNSSETRPVLLHREDLRGFSTQH
jgi:hypothetical protein